MGTRAAGVVIGAGMILDGKPIMGSPIEVTPAEALQHCVRIAAGEVAYCTLKVNQLTEKQVLSRPTKITEENYGNGRGSRKVEHGHLTVHVWVRERQRCVDRLARLAKMSLDAGVAEREVALQERMADVLVRFATGLFEDLGIDRASDKLQARARAAVERQLLALTIPDAADVEPAIAQETGA